MLRAVPIPSLSDTALKIHFERELVKDSSHHTTEDPIKSLDL